MALNKLTFKPRGVYNIILRLVMKLYLYIGYRGSYMSAHVLLNLLNKLRKSVKMQSLQSILLLFHNKFNNFNKT